MVLFLRNTDAKNMLTLIHVFFLWNKISLNKKKTLLEHY